MCGNLGDFVLILVNLGFWIKGDFSCRSLAHQIVVGYMLALDIMPESLGQ